jgi:hypothetical protein
MPHSSKVLDVVRRDCFQYKSLDLLPPLEGRVQAIVEGFFPLDK